MKIRLNSKLFKYLHSNWYNTQISFDLESVIIYKGTDFVIVEINEDMADSIRDWANNQLVLTGFDMNYELTIEGKILEEISDRFFVK